MIVREVIDKGRACFCILLWKKVEGGPLASMLSKREGLSC